MFDLDHFKTFNDTFGHEAGDSVLRELGAFLSRNVRAEDIPCRFGGEEFVLILPGATLEGARSRAERLRSKVRELTVMHQGKSVGMITISVGVGAFPVHGFVGQGSDRGRRRGTVPSKEGWPGSSCGSRASSEHRGRDRCPGCRRGQLTPWLSKTGTHRTGIKSGCFRDNTFDCGHRRFSVLFEKDERDPYRYSRTPS